MDNNKTAMVVGVGQDGYHISLLLRSKGYNVIGVNRRSSQPRKYLLPLVEAGVELVEGDVSDYSSMEYLLKKYRPEHLYNLCAQSHVGTSFNEPLHTSQVNYMGVLNLLEVIRHNHPSTRLFHASTSEMFGSSVSVRKVYKGGLLSSRQIIGDGALSVSLMIDDSKYDTIEYQDMSTNFSPNSPYAIAKLAAHHSVRLYRESYNMFCCSAITFNHEGTRRGENFVTRKITTYIGRLAANNFRSDYPKLKLGNINSYRDWSDSRDVVRAMVLMLEADKPVDYIVGSGETYSVRDFLKEAFSHVGKDWEDWVEIDPNLIRPAEVDYLRSDPSQIKKELGWKTEISFKELVQTMVIYDVERAKQKFALYGSV